MPTSSPLFGLPVADGTDSPPNLETVMQAYTERLEAILAGICPASGVADIPAAQSTASGVDVALGTPDRVSDLMLPDDNVRVGIMFRALVKGNGTARLRLNGATVRFPTHNSVTPAAPIATFSSTKYTPLHTGPFGLAVADPAPTIDTAYITDPEIPQAVSSDAVIGGPIYVEFPGGAPDTVTVQIDWKALAGSITAKNRKLWAWVLPGTVPPA